MPLGSDPIKAFNEGEFPATAGLRRRRDPDKTDSMQDNDSGSSGHRDEADHSFQSSDHKAEIQQDDEGSSYVIAAVVILATLLFSGATTLLVETNQRKFQTEFASFSREFNDHAWSNLDTIVSQMATLSVAVTSESVDTGTAPNITIHNLDRRAQEIVDFTGIDMILYAPIVETMDMTGWQQYASESSQRWIAQDYKYRGWDISTVNQTIPEAIFSSSGLFFETKNQNITAEQKAELEVTDAYIDQVWSSSGYVSGSNIKTPIAQFGPALTNSSLLLMDLFAHPTFRRDMTVSLKYSEAVLTQPMDVSFLVDHILPQTNYTNGTMQSAIIYPVREDFRPNSGTSGFLIAIVSWEIFFTLDIPANVNGIYTVVRSNCGSDFTFVRNGGSPSFFASTDIHDPRYDEDMVVYPFFERQSANIGDQVDSQFCRFDFNIYPSNAFRDSFDPLDPSLYSGMVVFVFVFFGAIFFMYDRYIKNRRRKLEEQAKRAEAIVTSVFPKEVGLRLIEQANREAANPASSKKMLNNFLAKNENDMASASLRRKPIADLFPNTTVMFADLVGFTAWASTREPSQVFILLETIYKEFDTLAKKREVFKVETVGDCYVAVCGLPEPKKDHPIAMCLFAADCLASMSVQVQSLEEELGPDTADLGIRVGLHSGPVTAGVLRGDRARFQLFGDTVNTCARVETTGEKNRIHISKDTADLLTKMGKSHWVLPRKDKVYAKGKGEMQTYWIRNLEAEDGIEIGDSNQRSSLMMAPASFSNSKRRVALNGSIQRKPQDLNPRKFDRLVNWNVDVLTTLLKQVLERREALELEPDDPAQIKAVEQELSVPVSEGGTAAFDQVVESIELAGFSRKNREHLLPVEVNAWTRKELKDYVRTVASMYNDNPFHNFEHASHVTMSVMKLLSRIVAPDIEGGEAQLHDHTYGITSDPLTQFAVVLSALLHDLDHLGVPNTALVKEVPELSRMYKDKSVAEQNSIDLAWTLLMEDKFENLRAAIYTTTSELRRFRQLMVNTVLATDIMDKELKAVRNAKWDKAFSQDMNNMPSALDNNDDNNNGKHLMEINNRKATVVIEHLIQASDIAHTMQHWQVYRKWNQRLFREMYRAYSEGHADKDPSEGWYEGEIGFFDFYIIPLAKKLEECGVFGVSSHEYLNYAEQNRKEWEKKGRSVVADYVEELQNEQALAEKERTH